ncbi:hypothetical protein EDB89DRAFT_2072266 [Lactarius sanguifluus]|nr:hypothetical protein EDB89DRAFT_2072266 [Lactarius sanguifluus]
METGSTTTYLPRLHLRRSYSKSYSSDILQWNQSTPMLTFDRHWHAKPFGHIILTQTLLAELFSWCSGANSQGASPTADGEEQVNGHVHAMLLALHRWLQVWLKTPNASPNAIPPGGTAAEQKTGLMSDPSSPFSPSPFSTSSLSSDSSPVAAFTLPPAGINATPDAAQFRLIKSWLHHIRLFLRRSQGSPTVVWDELMKIRLSGWQEDKAASSQQDPLLGEAQKDGGGADDSGSWPECDGLIGFFEGKMHI